MADNSERIQKLLANQGLASRREIERWIEAGRITLNGKQAKLGDCYTPGDKIAVDNKPVHFKPWDAQNIQGLMYYKPEGEVVTRSDEKGRKTVFDNLPACETGRWVNVGRLDISTSGLLLLTNFGELANRLMHPKYQMTREYAVRVLGEVSDEQLENMAQGVELEDGKANFETIEDAGGRGSNHWYHVTLREGRNREVRRLWESQDIMVSRLIRVRFGQIPLDKTLRAGQHRELRPAELNQLLNEVGLPTIKPLRVAKKGGRRYETGAPERGRRKTSESAQQAPKGLYRGRKK